MTALQEIELIDEDGDGTPDKARITILVNHKKLIAWMTGLITAASAIVMAWTQSGM